MPPEVEAKETEITPPETEEQTEEKKVELKDEKLISPENEITPPEKIAPDEYKDFTLPEGMEVNKNIMNAFKEIAKGAQLSQENAQKIYSEMAVKLREETFNQQKDFMDNKQKEWTKELVADKDFGGDKFNETFQRASRTLRKFDSEGKLLDLLTQGGILKSAPVIRFLATIDKSISEDTIVEGNKPKPEKDPAKVLFPDFK